MILRKLDKLHFDVGIYHHSGLCPMYLQKSPAQIVAANTLKMTSNAIYCHTKVSTDHDLSVLAERTGYPELAASTGISHSFFDFFEAACIVISVSYSSR